MKKPFLTIFLPCGVCWEITPDHIRTRRTETNKVIMPARKFPGDWRPWLVTAKNLTDKRKLCTP